MAQPMEIEPGLAEVRAASAQLFPQEFLDFNRQFIAELEASVVPGTLNVGDEAPDFTLAAAGSGVTHTLSQAVRNGPVVLSFYRGQW